MKKYAQLIEDLRAKNLTDTRIKEAILEKSKKEINHFNFWFKGFKVKAEGKEGKTIEIEGYASTKDIDRYGDVVNPMAFEETIELFMANPVMLLQHDHNKRIGDFTELKIDDNGLYVKGEVKYTAGDSELFAKIENKSLRGFSIGFRVLEAEWKDLTDEKGNVIDWIFVINKLDLVEISVVNVPANPYTLMKSVEDLAIKSAEELLDETNDNQDNNSNDGTEEQKEEEQEEKSEDGDGDPWKWDDDKSNKKVDEINEKDNISNEDGISENPTETEDGEEAGEKDLNKFTTKAIEKIVDAKLSGNEKALRGILEKEVSNITKEFTRQLDAVKSEFNKELDQIANIIKEVKETEEDLVEKIKGTIKGKWFLNLKTTKEKEVESTRLAYILSGVKNNKF